MMISNSKEQEIKTYGLTIRITDQEYIRISSFIEQRTGIRLPETKRVLVEGRLQKLLRKAGYTSFTPFLDKCIGKHANEKDTTTLIDLITTNKTDFFREADHFTHLEQFLINKAQKSSAMPTIKVWCAASSTGEEAYTLAIVLNELKLKGIIPDFEITATDISHQVLQKGIRAEYHISRIEPITVALRKKYLLIHKNKELKQVRIVKSLRDKVSFQPFNLLHSQWSESRLFDIIFCRNVYIYFDRTTQFNVTKNLIHHLKSDGALYLGHSETLNGLSLPIKPIANAVYVLNSTVQTTKR